MAAEKPRLTRELVAMRVARELRRGDVVNLGIGLPPAVCVDRLVRCDPVEVRWHGG